MTSPDSIPPSQSAEPTTIRAEEETALPPRAQGSYERMRDRAMRWAQQKHGMGPHTANALLILPDLFRLICGLSVDPDVPAAQKAKLMLAIFYIASPLDFLPEALFGPAAYLDDLVVAVIVLNLLLNKVDEEIVLRHWKGEGNAISIIKHYVAVADELAGSGLLRRLNRFLES